MSRNRPMRWPAKQTEVICACGKPVYMPVNPDHTVREIYNLRIKLIHLSEQRAILGPLDEIVADIEHTQHRLDTMVEYLTFLKEIAE